MAALAAWRAANGVASTRACEPPEDTGHTPLVRKLSAQDHSVCRIDNVRDRSDGARRIGFPARSRHLHTSLPRRLEINVEFDEFDRTVGGELSDDCDARDEQTGNDQDPIVRTTDDQLRKLVEASREYPTIRNSSNTWKSCTDGSPFGPRSGRSCASRSSKNADVARTARRSTVMPSVGRLLLPRSESRHAHERE